MVKKPEIKQMNIMTFLAVVLHIDDGYVIEAEHITAVVGADGVQGGVE